MMVVLSSHLLATPLQQLAAQVSRRSGTTRPSNLRLHAGNETESMFPMYLSSHSHPCRWGLITMRRALMELALCHFWAAYDSKSPNPWRRHALRIGDHLWARYGVVKMDIILSRNSPPLEYILDFGIAQVAGSWLELVLPIKPKEFQMLCPRHRI